MPLSPDVQIEHAALIVDTFAAFGFLEKPLGLVPLAGTGDAWQVQTALRKLFVKRIPPNERAALDVYDWARQALLAKKLRQARLFRLRDGSAVTPTGCAVYEFLPGRPVEDLSDVQFDRQVRYLGRYLRALQDVPTDVYVGSDSLWSKPFELDFLEYELPLLLSAADITDQVREVAEDARKAIVTRRVDIAALPVQLIHSDIGPGNILFRGDTVTAIVDFTPELANHVYPFCVSLFWHCINHGVNIDRIQRGRRLYMGRRVVTPAERELFPTFLLYATAYRLFVRILAGYSPDRLAHIAGRTREVMAVQW